jgi:hypothetical protein
MDRPVEPKRRKTGVFRVLALLLAGETVLVTRHEGIIEPNRRRENRMKSRLRLTFPGLTFPVITTAMLLGAAPSLADNSANRFCPDPSAGWFLAPTAIYPDAANKDKNNDGFVCAKFTGPATKDNNNPEFTDDVVTP